VQYDVLLEEMNGNLWLCVHVRASTIIQITYDIYAYKTKCTYEKTIMCLLLTVDNRNIRFVELIQFEIYMKQFIHHSVYLCYNQLSKCVCVCGQIWYF
jgi:hypothetical protein